MKKLILLTMFLAGCATSQTTTQTDPVITAGKTLLATQQTIVGLRDAIGVPCQKGIIPQIDCITMDGYYKQSKPLYDAAVTAWNTGSPDATAKKAALEQLAGQIAAIAIKYGVGGAN